MPVSFHNSDTNYRLSGGRTRAAAWLREVAQREGKRCGQVAMIFCSDATLLDMNRQFLGHDYFTDVITFDYSVGVADGGAADNTARNMVDTSPATTGNTADHLLSGNPAGDAIASHIRGAESGTIGGTIYSPTGKTDYNPTGSTISAKDHAPNNPAGGTIGGDIYISVETVARNAALYGATPAREMLRVVVHGVLHLCGYGDKTAVEEKKMRAKEDEYLALYEQMNER